MRFAGFAPSLGREAGCKVASQGASGFALAYEVDLAVDPKAAYDAFVNVGGWWSSDHTYSHDAKNLTIDVKNGGCWCETLPGGGFVRHMEIANAAPGERLVFSGGLGPLAFMGVAGSMSVTFAKKDKGTHVTLHYAVGGYEQFKRSTNFAATGKP